MIILKERGAYLDNKSGGDGLTGSILRLFSKDARKCNKGRHGEDTVIDALHGLDNSYYLINDVILPTSRGNIDHVLITPKGIFTIETKHWEGEIICHGDEWHRRYHKGLFTTTTKDFLIGSPSKQVKMNAFNLSKLIESKLFHNTFRVWVEGIVVFTSQKISIELHEPTVTILKVRELYNYIISARQISPLSKSDIESIGKFIINISIN